MAKKHAICAFREWLSLFGKRRMLREAEIEALSALPRIHFPNDPMDVDVN